MRPLRIATDCSGIEAPLEALRQLKIPFQQVFRSEIDKSSRYLANLNYPEPEIDYKDLLLRNNKDLSKLSVDLYVCGFPCQSFSIAGKRLGMNDPRANILTKTMETIKYLEPKMFILENVKNFARFGDKPGDLLRQVVGELEKYGYSVFHKVLNTMDYGIPQNRERIFIIGIKGEKANFEFPKKIKMKPLESIITDTTIHPRKLSISLAKNINNKNSGDGWIVTPFGFSSSTFGYSPTLTTNCNSFFHTTYNRSLNVKEVLALQGFSKKFKQGDVANSQMFKRAGNTMSVNVLKLLIKSLIKELK